MTAAGTAGARPATLRVLCEGPTEQNFVTQVLGPHLRPFGVFAKAEPLRRGQFGVVSWQVLYEAIKADVGRSKPHEFVTTMLDLYSAVQAPGARRAGL